MKSRIYPVRNRAKAFAWVLARYNGGGVNVATINGVTGATLAIKQAWSLKPDVRCYFRKFESGQTTGLCFERTK